MDADRRETFDYLLGRDMHPKLVALKISAALHRNRVHVAGSPLTVVHFFLGMVAALQQSTTMIRTDLQNLFVTCRSNQLTLAVVQCPPANPDYPKLRIVAFGVEKKGLFTIGRYIGVSSIGSDPGQKSNSW